MDSLAISAGVEAFKDQEYFEQTCQKVMSSRERLTAELVELGFHVLPSAANFIFVQHPEHDAEQLALGLREKGVVVRHFKHDRINQFLRISIGTPEENQQFLTVLDGLV